MLKRCSLFCLGSPECGHLASCSHMFCDQQLALLHHGHDSMPSLRRAPEPGTGLSLAGEDRPPWFIAVTSQPCLSLTSLSRASACPDQTKHTQQAGPSVKSSQGLVSWENTSSPPDAKRRLGCLPDPQVSHTPSAWLAQAAAEGMCSPWSPVGWPCLQSQGCETCTLSTRERGGTRSVMLPIHKTGIH